MWPILKQKVRAVLPKPKLIVYIGRSQKSPFTLQFSIPNFQIPNSQILNVQIPNFQIMNF